MTTTFIILGFIVFCIMVLLYRTKPKGMNFSQFMSNSSSAKLFTRDNIPQFQTILGMFFIFCTLNLFFTEPKTICGKVKSEKTFNHVGKNGDEYQTVKFILEDIDGDLYKGDHMSMEVYKSIKGEVCIERMGDYTKLFTILSILSGSLIVLLIFFRNDVEN